MRILVMAAATALLAACATATPYQPAPESGRYGFAERQIEADRVAVSFEGNSLTDREQVETYLLYRAAEVTLAAGKDHFILVKRDTDAKRRYTGVGGSAYGGFYADYAFYSPRWGWRPYGGPWGYGRWDEPTFREVTRYRATAEIVLRSGPKPGDDPNAFDARQVVENLKPHVLTPAPR